MEPDPHVTLSDLSMSRLHTAHVCLGVAPGSKITLWVRHCMSDFHHRVTTMNLDYIFAKMALGDTCRNDLVCHFTTALDHIVACPWNPFTVMTLDHIVATMNLLCHLLSHDSKATSRRCT